MGIGMKEAPIELTIPVGEYLNSVGISKDREMIVGSFENGYVIVRGNTIIKRRERNVKCKLIRDKKIAIVSNQRTISFYNHYGTLVWKTTYDKKIMDISFEKNNLVVLLADGTIKGIMNFKSVLWDKVYRQTHNRIILDSLGKYFVVYGDRGIDFGVFMTGSREWGMDFVDEVKDVAISKNGSRVAVLLNNGDFYLINRMGRKILEYKIKDASRIGFDSSGNIILSETGGLRIMNEQGTLLKRHVTEGTCTNIKSSDVGNYNVCVDDSGHLYFFNTHDIIWEYQHSSPLLAVDVTQHGEYVLAANNDILLFNNLTYYMQILDDTKSRISSARVAREKKERLVEIYTKMKMAYVKRNFEVMLNYKSLFDNIYGSIPKKKVEYVILLDKVFSPDRVSRLVLYVRGITNPKIQVFGNVKYGLKKFKRAGGVEKFYVMIKPVASGNVKMKIVIGGKDGLQIPLTIPADGKERNVKIISNTDYRKLREEYSRSRSR